MSTLFLRARHCDYLHLTDFMALFLIRNVSRHLQSSCFMHMYLRYMYFDAVYYKGRPRTQGSQDLVKVLD